MVGTAHDPADEGYRRSTVSALLVAALVLSGALLVYAPDPGLFGASNEEAGSEQGSEGASPERADAEPAFAEGSADPTRSPGGHPPVNATAGADGSVDANGSGAHAEAHGEAHAGAAGNGAGWEGGANESGSYGSSGSGDRSAGSEEPEPRREGGEHDDGPASEASEEEGTRRSEANDSANRSGSREADGEEPDQAREDEGARGEPSPGNDEDARRGSREDGEEHGAAPSDDGATRSEGRYRANASTDANASLDDSEDPDRGVATASQRLESGLHKASNATPSPPERPRPEDGVNVTRNGTQVAASAAPQHVEAGAGPAALPARNETPVETPRVPGLSSCPVEPCRNATVVENRTLVETEPIASRTATVPGTGPTRRCVQDAAGLLEPCVEHAGTENRSAQTPRVPGQRVDQPGLQVGPVCEEADEACRRTDPIPSEQVATLPGWNRTEVLPRAEAALWVNGTSLHAAPGLGGEATYGPYGPYNVSTEDGNASVELCPDGCSVPARPDVGAEGQVELRLRFGTRTVQAHVGVGAGR